MTATLGTSPWHVFEVSSRRRRHFREVRLFCRDGVAVLPDSYADHIAVQPAAPDAATPPALALRAVPSELPLVRELRAFVSHLSGGPPPKSSAAEGLAVVRAIAELRRLATDTPPRL